MEEKKEFKLFREKSLEAIESPESMNDYLQVTYRDPDRCHTVECFRQDQYNG